MPGPSTLQGLAGGAAWSPEPKTQFGHNQSFAKVGFVELPKRKLDVVKRVQRTRDMVGRVISVGSRVWVTPSAPLYKFHPDFRREFRRIAGQTKTVVGWDATGGAHIVLGRHELITVDCDLLKVMGHSVAYVRPMPSERPSWRI
jgi:hypothetical protein